MTSTALCIHEGVGGQFVEAEEEQVAAAAVAFTTFVAFCDECLLGLFSYFFFSHKKFAFQSICMQWK